MAKEIKEIKPPVKSKPDRKGTTQVDITKDVSDIEQIRLKELIRQVAKLSLRNRKYLAVYVSFTAKGEVSVVHFGAVDETKVKAHYLATKIADSIPAWIEGYDIPQMDTPIEKVKS